MNKILISLAIVSLSVAMVSDKLNQSPAVGLAETQGDDLGQRLAAIHNEIRSDPTRAIERIEYVLKYVNEDKTGYSLPEWGGYFTMTMREYAAWPEALEYLKKVKSGELGPLPAIEVNSVLTAAAKRHIDDICPKNLFSHTGSDGSTPK